MTGAEIFKHWKDVRESLYRALDSLSSDQLAFCPREGLWSLHETVCHIAGMEDTWFRYYVTGEMRSWKEADYKPADFPTPEALKDLLETVHARVVALYAEDADSKLKEVVALPWGPKVEQGWVVWHVLEHEIHHRGEIYLMMGLIGIEPPDV